MQKINLISLLVLLAVFLSSCEKEEALWELPPSGQEKIVTVHMGEDYETVIYFKLEDGSAVLRQNAAWDLAFAAQASEFHIIMNGGKAVQVYNTHDTDFTKTHAPSAGSPWQWDNPNGHKDSTAFGTWLTPAGTSKKDVYIIDMGNNASPKYRKMQLLGANATSYTFRFSNLDNTEETLATIAKNTTASFTYYQFATAKVIDDYEPADWDFVFTKYRHIYFDMNPVTAYPVTGVLINTRGVAVIETTTLSFESIDYEKASLLTLGEKADEIGFDWKFYDLNGSGKYIIDSKKVYVLRDRKGVLYKLKFTGFYNEQGLKGSPKFIYQRL